jgi:hypothetical protein
MRNPTLADVLNIYELEFLSQLFKSDIPVTLNTCEHAASLKAKVLSAQPTTQDPSLPSTQPIKEAGATS